MLQLAHLSLGSNMGDRQAHLREAIARLVSCGRVKAVSSFYETEPVGFRDQAWFLNCAVALETARTPEELIECLLGIEREMGRQRIQKNGPRIIDIDILLMGNVVVTAPDLTIPHRAMTTRRFVLAPLADIDPEAIHPVVRKTVRELLAELPSGPAVRKIEA